MMAGCICSAFFIFVPSSMKNIHINRKMEKETKAIHTPLQKRDAYGALSFPVYNTVAYEFDSAQVMTEAFAGRVPEPDY